MGAIDAKTGIATRFTITERFTGEIHCPLVAVNVYVPELALLTMAGLQVPLMPLMDTSGKTGAIEPAHMGAMAAKVGVVSGVTVTTLLAEFALQPDVPTVTK